LACGNGGTRSSAPAGDVDGAQRGGAGGHSERQHRPTPLQMTQPTDGGQVRGQVDGLVVPRFAGPPTFARLPRLDEVARCDLAIVGIPFDSGTTYRPGARFGPAAIRQGSKLLRPYNAAQDTTPFDSTQVADVGLVTRH